MQIKRHVEIFDALPERGIRRMVVVDDLLAATDLRESVCKRALEPELSDRPSELLCRRVRVLQRQRRECAKSIGLARNRLREYIVSTTGDLDGASSIGNSLNCGRV